MLCNAYFTYFTCRDLRSACGQRLDQMFPNSSLLSTYLGKRKRWHLQNTSNIFNLMSLLVCLLSVILLFIYFPLSQKALMTKTRYIYLYVVWSVWGTIIYIVFQYKPFRIRFPWIMDVKCSLSLHWLYTFEIQCKFFICTIYNLM